MLKTTKRSSFFTDTVDPNYFLENMFAELTKFTNRMIEQSGYHVPHNSPVKNEEKDPEKISIKVAFINHKLSQHVLSRSRAAKELNKANLLIQYCEKEANRSYPFLIEAAKSFKVLVTSKSKVNLFHFLKTLHCDTRCLSTITEVSTEPVIMKVILFLYLVHKYPQTDQDEIWDILTTTPTTTTYTIYHVGKQIQDILFHKTPTRKALKIHCRDLSSVKRSLDEQLDMASSVLSSNSAVDNDTFPLDELDSETEMLESLRLF